MVERGHADIQPQNTNEETLDRIDLGHVEKSGKKVMGEGVQSQREK